MSFSFGPRSSGLSICSRCLMRRATSAADRTLHRSSIHTKRKLHGNIIPEGDVQKNMFVQEQPSFQNYFSANTSIDRGWVKNGLLAAWQSAARGPQKSVASSITDTPARPRSSRPPEAPDADSNTTTTDATTSASHPVQYRQSESAATTAESQDTLLPHRRRQHRTAAAAALRSVGSASSSASEVEVQLPLDASSQLTNAASLLPTSATVRRRIATYLALTKPRLSFLVVLTTASAYSLYPVSDILSEAAHAIDASSTLSTTTLTLTFLTFGTFLCSASANTFNMLFEPKYDALMSRTRNRPLVRKLITRRAAMLFALLCGGGGILLLDLGTNPTVAALGALNIFLYAGIYTPMKRMSPINTWVGAIVGGIPPLMGWSAAAGEAATSEHHSWRDLLFSEDSIGGWLLAGLLFAWQFPHFNSLSHNIRDDYRQAGHKMLAWMNPAMNARVALRYSVAMFPICAGLYYVGIVNEGFLVISTACNAWMLKEAVRFWKKQGAGGSARGLFWASVWQLPLVLIGAQLCKVGIWDGFFGTEAVSIYEEDEEDQSSAHDSLRMGSIMESQRTGVGSVLMGHKRPD